MNTRFLLLFSSITILVLLPLVPLLIWSFSDQWFYPALLPQQWGTRSWNYVFTVAGSQLGSGLIQSTYIAAVTSILSLLIGIPAGRALGLYSFPGKRLIALILLLPVIIPPLCVSMGLHLWFIKLGLAETFTGVVLVHLSFCLPYCVFVLWGVFADYDPDFELQARTLGASSCMIYIRVMLPMIIPGLCIAALFSFLLSWSQYLSTLIIGGGKLLTLPILLFSLMESGDRPIAAAVSLVFVLPAGIVLLVSSHFLGRGGLTGIR